LFPAERVACERILKQSPVTREVCIEYIYDVLQKRWDLADKEKHMIMECEVAEHTALCRGNPEILHAVDVARHNGCEIIFVSDMFLPRSVIAEILRSAGYEVRDNDVYVSCSVGANKVSGSIFKYVCRQRNVAPASILHVGDDPHADCDGASMAGVACRCYRGGALNRYEEVLLAANCGKKADLSLSLLAGACRYARLKQKQRGGNEWRVPVDVAASVSAPVAIFFGMWVLDNARHRDIRRVYFVSRDTQPVFRVCQELNRHFRYGLDLRYLYGSRLAWYPASICRAGDIDMDWLVPDIPGITLRMVQSRSGLDLSDFGELDRPLQATERQELRRKLYETKFLNRIVEVAHGKRSLVLKYLRQEGLAGNEETVGFVDVSGSGKTQAAVERILAGEKRSARLAGMYFTLLDSFVPTRGTVETFFADARLPTLRLDIARRANTLLEILFTADHNSVSGYAARNDPAGVVPTFVRARRTAEWVRLGRMQQEVILAVVRSWLSQSPSPIPHEVTPLLVYELVRTLVLDPLPEEARFFGRLFVPVDHEVECGFTLAPPLKWRDMWEMAVHGGVKSRPRFADWPEARYRASSLPARLAYRLLSRLKGI